MKPHVSATMLSPVPTTEYQTSGAVFVVSQNGTAVLDAPLVVPGMVPSPMATASLHSSPIWMTHSLSMHSYPGSHPSLELQTHWLFIHTLPVSHAWSLLQTHASLRHTSLMGHRLSSASHPHLSFTQGKLPWHRLSSFPQPKALFQHLQSAVHGLASASDTVLGPEMH